MSGYLQNIKLCQLPSGHIDHGLIVPLWYMKKFTFDIAQKGLSKASQLLYENFRILKIQPIQAKDHKCHAEMMTPLFKEGSFYSSPEIISDPASNQNIFQTARNVHWER